MSLSFTDMALLGKVLEEHGPRLLVMLKRRIDPTLVKRIDPEDLLSEVCLVAQRRWSEFNAQAPYAWFYQLALDCLIEAWRRETRDCRNLQRDVPWPEASSMQLCLSLVAPGTSPTGAALRHEAQERMRQTLLLL